MSAREITQAISQEIAQRQPHFICLNYANADMVGHTGVFEAAKQAVSTVDDCLSGLVPQLLEKDYAIIIIADHGNSDMMINPDGSPNTAHTKNPVPCIFVSNRAQTYKVENGKLADIAPTILSLMQLPIPAQMNGEVIIHPTN
jgi:2,3-bisphosphoglycerate-independent phosphoglycerate mutase